MKNSNDFRMHLLFLRVRTCCPETTRELRGKGLPAGGPVEGYAIKSVSQVIPAVLFLIAPARGILLHMR